PTHHKHSFPNASDTSWRCHTDKGTMLLPLTHCILARSSRFSKEMHQSTTPVQTRDIPTSTPTKISKKDSSISRLILIAALMVIS
ncbi:Hypothetical predicted protein, partial [Pelobates cultripes]